MKPQGDEEEYGDQEEVTAQTIDHIPALYRITLSMEPNYMHA